MSTFTIAKWHNTQLITYRLQELIKPTSFTTKKNYNNQQNNERGTAYLNLPTIVE
jgi:hypothetical protein